jgi:hypothetical protein
VVSPVVVELRNELMGPVDVRVVDVRVVDVHTSDDTTD